MVDLVSLFSKILHVKGTPEKSKQKFVGPFNVEEKIGRQAYGQEILNSTLGSVPPRRLCPSYQSWDNSDPSFSSSP